MTTEQDTALAALAAQAAEYAERMMRREWRVVPQAGVEPGDERANWYIEAIDTRFGMHSLVMWAYQSKAAYDRAFLERVCAEHNATIRDALDAAETVERELRLDLEKARANSVAEQNARKRAQARVAELEALGEQAANYLMRYASWTPERDAINEVASKLRRAALAPGEPKSCMCSNRSVADYEGPLRECPIHGEPKEEK